MAIRRSIEPPPEGRCDCSLRSPRRASSSCASQALLAQQDPLPSWNDTAPKRAIVAFVERVTLPRLAGLRAAGGTHRNVRQRRHAVGRAAGLRAAAVRRSIASRRSRRGIPSGGRSSRSPPCSKAICAGARQRRRARADANDGGHAYRHDHRGVQRNRQRLDRDRPPPDHRQALHGDGLSADARAARLLARQRLQDLHRLRRRHRVHAPVDGEGLRNSAGAGHRQQRRAEVRAARRHSRCC